jgi:hypothetical protein
MATTRTSSIRGFTVTFENRNIQLCIYCTSMDGRVFGGKIKR